MKIVIPSKDGKLCAHFGNCEYFSFVETNDDTKEIVKIENLVPKDGVSCQSAGWIAENGADFVLAGGMGGRPFSVLIQNGVKVIPGCPELEIETIVKQFMDETLEFGENSCGGGHHDCHGHGEHHCGHHHN